MIDLDNMMPLPPQGIFQTLPHMVISSLHKKYRLLF